MIKFLKSFPFHVKSAFQGLKRHMAMTISASSAVAVTLILMAIFLLLTGNINSFTRNIEADFKIHVTIDAIKNDEEIKEMEKQIKAMPEIKTIEFSDKDDELEALIKEKGNLFDHYRGEANPMRNAFIIEVNQSDQIAPLQTKLAEMNGVVKAEYGGEAVGDMIAAFEALRNGGAIFVVALSFLAIFLISNTIKMTIYARNQEIAIMRNVGAANWFIKTPFIMEGMVIGLIGASIPALLTYFGYNALFNALGGYFLSTMFVMQPMNPFVYIICGTLLICGILVGAIGSFMAVSKYLRWKR